MEDFLTFRKLITPTIIKIVFWIGVVILVIGGLDVMISDNFLIGLLIIVLGPIMLRIYIEIVLIFFLIYQELRSNGELLRNMGQKNYPPQY